MGLDYCLSRFRREAIIDPVRGGKKYAEAGEKRIFGLWFFFADVFRV